MAIGFAFGLLMVCASGINAISDELKEMAQVLHDACVEETDVEERFIEDCRNGVFPEDRNLMCYMRCLMTKVPMMTEEGNIDEEFLIDVIPDEYKDVATPVIRNCGTVRGLDDCETAFLTNKCWYNEAPEYFYLV